jgi:hypothetical protein
MTILFLHYKELTVCGSEVEQIEAKSTTARKEED